MSFHSGRHGVFLDRDGVLIESQIRGGKPYAVTAAEDVKIIPGVAGACRDLSSLGFLLVMTTNQPDVARGKVSEAFVRQTNAALAATLVLDSVEACLHDDADGCDCRKPKPGLMIHAATRLGIDLGASFVVGDRWRDVEAGKAAGCRTVFIDCGYDEVLKTKPDFTCRSLSDAVQWIRIQTSLGDT